MKNFIEGQSLWKTLICLLCIGTLGCKEGSFPDLSKEKIKDNSCVASIEVRNSIPRDILSDHSIWKVERIASVLRQILKHKGYQIINKNDEPILSFEVSSFSEVYSTYSVNVERASFSPRVGWFGQRTTKETVGLDKVTVESSLYLGGSLIATIEDSDNDTSNLSFDEWKLRVSKLIDSETKRIYEEAKKLPYCEVVQNLEANDEDSIRNFLERLKD